MRSAVTPYALLLSVLIHLFLSWELYSGIADMRPPERDHTLIAELVPPLEVQMPKREIAPPSETPPSKQAPPNARLSEKNTEAKKESIRRGEDVPPPPEMIPPKRTPPAPAKVPQKVAPPPKERAETSESPKAERAAKTEKSASSGNKGESKLGERNRPSPVLKLGANDLLAKLGPGMQEPSGDTKGQEAPSKKGDRFQDQKAPSDQEREVRLLSAEPFRKNSFASLLRPGVSDMLFQVPDGEITVLNEKADQFAVFVRRVANQVFGVLKRSSWGNLPASEVDSIQEFAKVRAILSPQGKFLSVELLDRSGSSLFDSLLKDAAAKGASDQNPPREAVASDGNYHFLFLARTWSRRAPSGEQRWLILGTGLE